MRTVPDDCPEKDCARIGDVNKMNRKISFLISIMHGDAIRRPRGRCRRICSNGDRETPSRFRGTDNMRLIRHSFKTARERIIRVREGRSWKRDGSRCAGVPY